MRRSSHSAHHDSGTITADLFTMLMMLFAVMMVVVATMLRTPIGQQLFEMTERITQLQAERDQASAEREQWRQAANEKDRLAERLAREKEEAVRQTAALQEASNHQDHQIKELRSSLARSKENASRSRQQTEHALAQARKSQSELTEATERNRELKQQVARTEAERDDLQNPVDAKPITMVIAIDTSASMAEEIARAQEDVLTLARVLPQVTSVRIGVVAYRGRPYSVFPVTKIESPRTDGGASLRRLEHYLGSLGVHSEHVDQAAAIRTALRMLDRAPQPGVASFCLIGDVGPFEVTHGLSSTAIEQQVLREVQAWCGSRELRGVCAIYTGEQNPDAAAHIAFFQRLAATADDRGSYSANPSRLLADLLLSSVAE